MQSTQATQAHRAPHCKHVLSRARCVVHLGPTVTHSFSVNTATPIRSCPPGHPYLCGLVLTTDTCHPSTYSTIAVAPHLQAVSHTAAQYRDAFVRPRTRTAQTGKWLRDLPYAIPTQRQRLSRAPRSVDTASTGGPPGQLAALRDNACLSPRPRIDEDPRISSTIEQARSLMHVM